MGTLAGLLDLVVPARCAACGAGETVLCDGCRAALVRLGGTLCARCGAPTAWPVERCGECAGRRIPFASARAAVAYVPPAPGVVAAWKDGGLRELASVVADLVVDVVPRPCADALTFVPGDRERVLWRGYNTAEALARELADRWALPARALLDRAGRLPRQRGRSRRERRANVRGSFVSLASAPAVVVLVDDVYTTGATVSAAATELRRGGARTVHAVAFARAVRR